MTDATPPEVLHRLCAHFGIALGYEDVWGRLQQVGADSLVAALAAFGVDATSAASAEQALQSIVDARWRSAVPPVCVAPAQAPIWTLAVRLPLSATALRWRITLESGEVREGDAGMAPAEPGAEEHRVDGVAVGERTVTIALPVAPGYHRLAFDGLAGETLVIGAPDRCYRPGAASGGRRLWGPAVQLYALRSERNWGMGDFTDLRELVGSAARAGAALVGLNPLHALFAHRPCHVSPYSPSSRRWLNVLYIDPEAAEGFTESTAAKALVDGAPFRERLAALRATALVDHEGVAAAKFEVLEMLFAEFRQRLAAQPEADGEASLDGGGDGGDPAGITGITGITDIIDTAVTTFRAFVRHGGEALRQHAIFEAMQAAGMAGLADRSHPGAAAPGSPALQAFVQAHADRVLFHQYLQWLADAQLRRAVDAARALGMAVGLYLDLAVSVDAGGSDAWSARELFASGARVGAPVDVFNPGGQDWGLLPLRADRLRDDGYRYLIATLRANMRNAGALRIDHVMGLMRLFWIAEGQTARSGTYVHYAAEEILAIVALESQRNRCMVIGEDLGTVAPEMREAMARRDMLSYRLLYFERDADGFMAPDRYSAAALVAVSTHDLATLRGWWCGEDLRVRLAQGLYPSIDIFERQLLDRSRERAELLLALQRAGLIGHEAMADFAFQAASPPALVDAVHRFLAATPCTLMVVQPEDFLGVVEQANLPGTTSEQPNWHRKLPIGLEAWAESPGILEAMAATAEARRAR